MVFCGRPSRACYECRVRRIKCDQLRLGCSQCSRADKSCWGYRDPGAVVIRDESRNVARKAHAQLQWEKEDGPTVKSGLGSGTLTLEVAKSLAIEKVSSSDVPMDSSLSYSAIPVSVEEQGFCFIFSHYIVVDSTLPNGDPDYSSTKTWKNASMSEIMRDALTSVGLAALSNVRNSQEIMVKARKKLSTVIQQTMATLQDPRKAQSDTMLRTVMMLWLFEMVTYDPRSAKTSLDHLNGAATLVTLRGSHNSENKGGLRKILRICFSTVCLMLFISPQLSKPIDRLWFIRYIQNDELYPSRIVDWTQLTRAFKNEMEFPACTLAHTLFTFISLRSSIKKREIIDPATILEKLLLIEADLTKWIRDLPSCWAFTTSRTTERSSNVFGGQLHTYHDIWISRVWSHYRWTRILVREEIQRHLALLPVSAALDFSRRELPSLTILRKMAADICVSVPFHLCNYNTQPDKTLPRPEIAGAFDLLWPLTVVASSDYVSEDMHVWAVSLLRSIGHTMGIKQAFVLISTVKAQRERKGIICRAEHQK